jgi:hypothetical protein
LCCRLRLLKVAGLLLFSLAISKSKRLRGRIDTATLLFYLALSVVIVFQFATVSYLSNSSAASAAAAAAAAAANNDYSFFRGRWSLPSSLMFTVVVYHVRSVSACTMQCSIKCS